MIAFFCLSDPSLRISASLKILGDMVIVGAVKKLIETLSILPLLPRDEVPAGLLIVDEVSSNLILLTSLWCLRALPVSVTSICDRFIER